MVPLINVLLNSGNVLNQYKQQQQITKHLKIQTKTEIKSCYAQMKKSNRAFNWTSSLKALIP